MPRGTTTTRNPLGPHAVVYLEHALAALADVPVSARTKLEAIGVLTSVVASLSRVEAEQRRVGQTLSHWQQAQQEYLTRAAGSGRHPHLATALSGARTGADGGHDVETEPAERTFDRVVTRVLAGLLGPDGD